MIFFRKGGNRGLKDVLLRGKNAFFQYLCASAAITALSLLMLLLTQNSVLSSPFEDRMTAFFFPVTVIIGGIFLDRKPLYFMAALSSIYWAFLFAEPFFSFNIASSEDFIIFVVIFFIALIMGELTRRINSMKNSYRNSERRTLVLYEFLKLLAYGSDPIKTLNDSLEHVEQICGCACAILLGESTGLPKTRFYMDCRPEENIWDMAKWVIKNDSPAGKDTDKNPEAEYFIAPLRSEGKAWGAICIRIHGCSVDGEVKILIMQICRLLGSYLYRQSLKISAEKQRHWEESKRIQKTLLDAVSHELKTPLSLIKSALEQSRAMISDGRGESALPLLQTADASSERLIRNVNMLLDMTRFNDTTTKVKSEICDMEDMLDMVAKELKSTYPDSSFTRKISPDCLIVRSDETLLYQLVSQLVRNAFAHSGSDKPVLVEISRSGNIMEIKVADFGKGVSNEFKEKIFDAFVTDKSGGLGLGLSIASRICRILGGEITLADTVPSGATFTAKIPTP